MLIEVTWPAGRIQREYPILLDPPGFATARVAPQAAAPAASPASRHAAGHRAGGCAFARPLLRRRPPPRPALAVRAAPSSPLARARIPRWSAPPAGETYGPVQKGETLRKIAGEVKPDGVSMEQMLVALYRENQAAFSATT